MWDENPGLIEDPEPATAAASAIPVVLIHDGGGTVFSYYCLYFLGRPVYGVFNPYFHSGERWEGGLPEMARHYVRLIRSVIGKGPIILGGWSLGGLISLEMARVLAGDRWLKVVGLVMVDSVCPLKWREDAAQAPAAAAAEAAAEGSATTTKTTTPVQVVAHRHVFGERTKQETKDKVMRCFAESSRMVGEWTLPIWGAATTTTNGGSATSSIPAAAPSAPPPAILLRAREGVPIEGGEGVSRVDVSRSDPRLGWDSYRRDLFSQVIEVPGHHFSIFAEENIIAVTDALKVACATLEDMYNSQ